MPSLLYRQVNMQNFDWCLSYNFGITFDGLYLCPGREFIKSFIQGLLPGIALKIFLILLPTILMMLSKFEGLVSISALERRSASKYYIFLLVNVFLGSIIAGTAFQQLDSFIHQSANEYVLLYLFHSSIHLFFSENEFFIFLIRFNHK